MPKISVKPILPQKIDPLAFRDQVKNVLANKTTPDLKREFKKGVRTWKNKPRFIHRPISTYSKLGVFVFPSGANKDQYSYVHDGTKPRIIRPRATNRSGLLRFRPGYSPATRRGMLTSRRAVRTGPFISKPFVRHPGIEARNFSLFIARRYKKTFEKDIEKAMSMAARM